MSDELTKKIAAIKLKILESNDSPTTTLLMHDLIGLQRELAGFPASEIIPVARPEPTRPAPTGNYFELVNRAEGVRSQLRRALAEGSDAAEQLQDELNDIQAQVSAIRIARGDGVDSITAEENRLWWDRLGGLGQTAALNAIITRADFEDPEGKIPKNAWLLGFARAMLDFVRAGRVFNDKEIARIRRAYES